MSQLSERIIPVNGFNLNIGSLYLGNDKARLIKNMDLTLLKKADGNILLLKPLTNAEVYDPTLELPGQVGENQTVGGGVSRGTNEVFAFNWNPDKNKFHLYRLKNGKGQIVFVGPELELELDPKFFISPNGRFFAERVCVGDEIRTYIYWTNGKTRQCFLCVEDSIATNSFDPVQFPFFAGPWDRRDFISLGVPGNEECIKITPVQSAANTLNLIKDQTHRFRISYFYRYGRPSEHGNMSDLYWTKDCVASAVGCLDITFNIGNPFVEKIQLEKQRGNTTEWDIIKIFDKYKNCDRPWYERPINPDLNYNSETNEVTYRYCGGESCIPIPDAETQRLENPLPDTSQSLFQLGNDLALANNTYGKKPFSCDLKDKISFTIEKPAPDPVIDQTTRNIVIWLSIWNDFEGESQAVWKKEDKTVFGGLASNGQHENGLIGDYHCYFADNNQEGFIGYLAGTKYACISKQYIYDSDNQVYVEHGVSTDMNEVRSNKWLQKFEFKNVPIGKYIFRVAGHDSKLTDADYQRTSTYVAGIGSANGFVFINNNLISEARELLVDVCNADFDSVKDGKNVMVLWDVTSPKTESSPDRRTRVCQGYTYETKNGDRGNIAIETADVVCPSIGINRRVYTTDHNGFYFISAKDSRYSVDMYVRKDCGWQSIERFTTPRSPGRSLKNFYATDKWPNYAKELCNRVLVRGRITECTTGAGIPGITVGITLGMFATTDDQGNYELIVHDRSTVYPRKLIYMAVGKCSVTTCSDSKCFPTRDYVQPGCTVCALRVVQIGEYKLKIAFLGDAGPQKMGKYEMAASGLDWLGRNNAAQTDARWLLNIPNENETQSFKYSRIRCTIAAGAVFPLWMKKLKIRISKNLAFNEFLTWVVDRFTFIDNTGLENLVSPTQIKVYYSSLNEFNKQYAFSTNVNWQIIDEKNSLHIQDRVHFVANGDGKIFAKTITALVKYDKEGQYFLIDYTSDLADLKEGAYLKFMRPSECNSSDVFYDLCKSVNIVDGKAAETDFYIDIFDSYQHNRQIPTPVTTTTKKFQAVAGTTNPIIYEEVEESVTNNIIKPYSWSFEHDSPSDFWGTKCTNRGRALPKNPYEQILCKPMECALSGAIGVNGIVSFRHYFDEKRKTPFPAEYGDIIAGISDANTIIFICAIKSFIAAFDDNSVRYDANGKAFLLSADNQFSKPRKAGDEGCQMDDRNTITYLNGTVSWFDSIKGTLAKNGMTVGVQDMAGDKCSAYLSFKSKDIQVFNRTAPLKRYWHSVINPADNQVYLTDFNLGEKSFTNDDDEVSFNKSDTLCFELSENFPLRKKASFTPELFMALEGDDKETQLFSFKNGVAYHHYRTVNTSFNQFYGVQCNHALRLIMATDNFKVKGYMGVETYVDNVQMYGKKVITESGQESWIPRNWFKRGENFWIAPFLCDINTIQDPNIPVTLNRRLTGGDKLRGRFVDVLFVGDPANLGKYFELTGVMITAIPVEKTGGGK